MKLLKLTLLLSLMTGLVVLASTAFASDHYDWPEDVLVNDPKAADRRALDLDLTDHYAWVPAPGKLALALNTMPRVVDPTKPELQQRFEFSRKVKYSFRIRKVKEMAVRNNAIIAVPKLDPKADEVKIDCVFPDGKSRKCTVSVGHKEKKVRSLRVHSGKIADPFIFDHAWADIFAPQTGKLAFRDPPNGEPAGLVSPRPLLNPINRFELRKTEVLNITLQFDSDELFSGYRGKIATCVEVEFLKDLDGDPNTPHRFERIGRPEITNLTIMSNGPKKKYKYDYNSADTFALSKKHQKLFSDLMSHVVHAWDRQDNVLQWTGRNMDDLVTTLLNDFLVVDLAKTCSVDAPDTYLDVERAVDRKPVSCGGRMPGGHLMDTMISFYVAGPRAPKNAFGPGARRKLRPSKTFPFFRSY